MDKRTRTLNAMLGKPVDRVPVNFYRHFDSFGDNEEEKTRNMIQWYQISNMDFIVEETDGYMEYPVDGDPRDIRSWRYMKPPKRSDPYFTGQVERTKRLIDGADGACLFYILFTPFSRVKHTIHDEMAVMNFYKEDKRFLSEILKRIEETNDELIDVIKTQTEAAGFFVSLQNAEINRFSAEEYVEYLAEGDRHLLESVNKASQYNITHMCSWVGVPNQIELWKKYDYQVVNWSVNIERNLDMQQARSFFKPDTVIMGGFDNREGKVLHRGTKEEIKAETKYQLALAGQDRTILSADCSVADDQSAEHISWIVEAAGEYSEGIR